MAPMPNQDHQELEFLLESWLRQFWAKTRNAMVNHQINVAAPGSWPNDYRIPDLVLLLPDRFAINRNEFFDGGPNVAVEIHSPGDEAYEKLEFYAKIEVAEVWIIDRDSRVPEVLVLQEGAYHELTANADGWLTSPATGVQMRSTVEAKLELQISADEATRRSIP